jgi:hypothetical protein
MHPWISWQPAVDHVRSAKHTFLTASLRHIYIHNIAWLNIRESKFFSQNVLCDTGIIILSKISRFTFVIQIRCFSSATYRPNFYSLLIRARGTRWHCWLRHCATNRKDAGSIPSGVNGILMYIYRSVHIQSS